MFAQLRDHRVLLFVRGELAPECYINPLSHPVLLRNSLRALQRRQLHLFHITSHKSLAQFSSYPPSAVWAQQTGTQTLKDVLTSTECFWSSAQAHTPTSFPWQALTPTCRVPCFSSTCYDLYSWKKQDKRNRKVWFSQWPPIRCINMWTKMQKMARVCFSLWVA